MSTDERTLEVFMDQNNKCNLKCRMCGFSDLRVGGLPKFDLPMALFEKIVDEILPRTRYLALSCMTEALMTRDFPERIALLPRAGVPFTELITNGTLLTDRIIEAILAVPLSRIAVSIDGATKETFEAVRPGAIFEKVIANVRRFSELKAQAGAVLPALRINHVVSELNEAEFPRFLELVESLSPQAIDVRTIVRMSDAVDRGPTDESFFARVREMLEMLDAWCARTGIRNEGYLRHQEATIEIFTSTGERLSCLRPWNTVAIHANGDVMPCISWTRAPVGNLALQSFDEIWRGEAAEAIRREFEAKKPGIDCQHCTIKKDVDPEAHDDFFYRMIAKGPGALREGGYQ